MKALVFSHNYPSSVFPVKGSFIHNQVRFLQAHCQVQVVAPVPWFPPLPGFGVWSEYRKAERQERLDGVEVWRPRRVAFPRRILFSQIWRFYLHALQRTTRKRLPDLVHAHWAYPEGRAAVEYGKHRGLPVVITAHGSDIRVWPHLRSRWMQLTVEALDGADAIIAVSRDLRDRIVEFGIDSRKVRLIPNGVDTRIFRMSAARHPGEGGWRLLFVGRFVREKGIEVLLEALALLRERAWNVSLTLIGGSAASGMPGLFRSRAKELDVADAVEFLGEVPWAGLPPLMEEADLFVLPSFSEGLPLVLLEAMACGLPLVATRCGGPEEIVDEEVGRLVEVGDPEDLARGIGEVLEHYDQYDRQAIRRRAVERYDYRKIAARIYEVYEEVLSGRHNSP